MNKEQLKAVLNQVSVDWRRTSIESQFGKFDKTESLSWGGLKAWYVATDAPYELEFWFNEEGKTFLINWTDKRIAWETL